MEVLRTDIAEPDDLLALHENGVEAIPCGTAFRLPAPFSKIVILPLALRNGFSGDPGTRARNAEKREIMIVGEIAALDALFVVDNAYTYFFVFREMQGQQAPQDLLFVLVDRNYVRAVGSNERPD